ncbi:MAG TPA: neutral/alkaline non-lysosomal ceramidase N-terminal domain-containing protein, partial [Baekduia sp.]|nr:neutral/alkaline non-lysosomal ceramidase N-terminal domain-containing protein [Baekduia sp.]
GGDIFDPRAFDVTAQGIAEALLRAVERLVPARVGVATAALRGASRNRALGAFRRNRDLPAGEAAVREASVDPTVTVVRADDLERRPIGVWSNFAVHPTSFSEDNLLFSGDNAATAVRLVEEELAAGARRRPAEGRPPVNVWTNGAEGDISPDGDPRRLGGEPLEHAAGEAAQAHLAGRRTAEGILRAWRSAGRRLTGDVDLAARRTFVAFDGTPAAGRPVGPVPVLGAGIVAGGTCSPVPDLAGPGQDEKAPLLGGPGLVPGVAPVSLWRVGDLGIAALPAEVTAQMGRRLRAGLQRGAGRRLRDVALAGLTNGYVSYTSTPEEYEACEYEGSFTLFGKQQGARFADVAGRLMRPLLDGGAAPAGAPEPAPAGLALGAQLPAPRTPGAGAVVREPQERVRRGGLVRFAWRGGHPSVDARRGVTLVTLERRDADGWVAVATDDGPQDITRLAQGTWTETLHVDRCLPAGTHRFRVTGTADRGAGARPYGVRSRSFEIEPLRLEAGPVTVSRGGVAALRARYPAPPEGALLSQPALVTSGRALLRVRPPGRRARTVAAWPKPARGTLEARVPRGSRVRLLGVRDGCANTT